MCLGVVLVFLPWIVLSATSSHLQSSSENSLSPAYSAIVLGAGLRSDGSPSDILRDRVEAGVKLYKSGKVKKLIMSGDNRFKNYSEPDVMKQVAIQLGVPAEDIQPDYAGRRTYDSCWRARHIFSQNETIIVTQSFHMTRAIFVCNQLGIKSQGFTADVDRYDKKSWLYWSLRDIISLDKSLIDIFVFPPKPVGGEKIQI